MLPEHVLRRRGVLVRGGIPISIPSHMHGAKGCHAESILELDMQTPHLLIVKA
jgi:hypothetical protein